MPELDFRRFRARQLCSAEVQKKIIVRILRRPFPQLRQNIPFLLRQKIQFSGQREIGRVFPYVCESDLLFLDGPEPFERAGVVPHLPRRAGSGQKPLRRAHLIDQADRSG